MNDQTNQVTEQIDRQQKHGNDPAGEQETAQQQHQAGHARYTMKDVMALVPPGEDPYRYLARLPRSKEVEDDRLRLVPDCSMGC